MASLVKQLMLHEGVRLKPYRCSAGKLTIGVGHNYEDTGLPKWLMGELGIKSVILQDVTNGLAKGFSLDMAERLLKDDITLFENSLRVEFDWFDGLDEIRKKVMVDMAFNMGMRTLRTFKNTLKMVANRDYDGASKGMLQSRWAKQVGKRAERLAHMMRTGKDYDSDGGFGAK